MPRAAAHHLAERPEGDALAVGGTAALVPVDVLGQPVDVLPQLPHQARLADPGDAGHVHQPRPPLPTGGVQQLLDQAQLLVPADERRLRAPPAPGATALADDTDRAPGRHRLLLALQRQRLDRHERDRPGRRPVGALADEHGARLGGGLQPRRGVDQVAGHQRLVDRADAARLPRR